MTIEKFIKKAIEGGWKQKNNPRIKMWHSKGNWEKPIEMALLDPLAWQAVGMSESTDTDLTVDMWAKKQMHEMIDAIIGGKTIEQFIETL